MLMCRFCRQSAHFRENLYKTKILLGFPLLSYATTSPVSTNEEIALEVPVHGIVVFQYTDRK